MTLTTSNNESLNSSLPDIETVRLIYTHKQNYVDGKTYAIHLTMTDLDDIQKKINELNVDGNVGNGVTLYIGEYPNNYPLIKTQGNEDYSNRLTVVAVPTYGDKIDGNYFDFMDAPTVISCQDRIDDGEQPDPTVSGLDHFRLCPPHNNCNASNVIWNTLTIK